MQVADYKDNLKKEAQMIVEEVFPRKVIELNKLLEVSTYLLLNIIHAHDDSLCLCFKL